MREKKILFITTRNVINTSGELRLIKNRTNTLKDVYGYETDFLVCRKDIVDHPEAINDTAMVKTYLFKNKSIKSRKRKWKELLSDAKDLLTKQAYSAMVFSGMVPTKVVKNIKSSFPSLKIIFDIHGSIDELKEFKGQSITTNLFRKFAYIYLNHLSKVTLPYGDGFFVVSETLKQHVVDTYKIDSNKKFFIVPCANCSFEISDSKQLSNRVKYRSKYGVNEDELVFIYSGGTSAWQCIDKSVSLYKKIKDQLDTKTKLFIFSGDLNYIKRFERDDVVVGSLTAKEVDDVLCMGDCAFLLRDNYVTNNVAYPNKFLEYVKGGLFVISTPYIGDVSKQICEYEIGTVSNDISIITADIKNKKPYGSDFGKRIELLKNVSFEKRLEPFVNYIEGK